MRRFIAATLESVGIHTSIAGAVVQASVEHGVAVSAIKSAHRSARRISDARQDAYRLAHEQGHSYAAIGRFFNRDHTTIMHGVNAAQKRAQG